jgi:hypothetical protein
MSTSITASNPNSPYNLPILSDAQLFQTASIGIASTALSSSTTALDFKFAQPWPQVAKGTVYGWVNALTNTANSALIPFVLQQSIDNVTWTTATWAPNPLFSTTDGGSNSAPAANQTVVTPPQTQRYLRLTAEAISGSTTAGGATGSFGIQWLA